MKATEFNRRGNLNQRFRDLYVGQFEEMSRLDDDSLELLVIALETAQAEGILNLETDSGIDLLKEVVTQMLRGE